MTPNDPSTSHDTLITLESPPKTLLSVRSLTDSKRRGLQRNIVPVAGVHDRAGQVRHTLHGVDIARDLHQSVLRCPATVRVTRPAAGQIIWDQLHT